MVPISYFIVDEGQLLVDLRKLLIPIGFNIELHVLQSILNAPDSLVVLRTYINQLKINE